MILETLRTDHQDHDWQRLLLTEPLHKLSEPVRTCLQILPGSAAANKMSVGGGSLSPFTSIPGARNLLRLSCCHSGLLLSSV